MPQQAMPAHLPGFILPDVGLLPLQLLRPGVPPAPHIRQRVLVRVVVAAAAAAGGGVTGEHQAHLAVDARHQLQYFALQEARGTLLSTGGHCGCPASDDRG